MPGKNITIYESLDVLSGTKEAVCEQIKALRPAGVGNLSSDILCTTVLASATVIACATDAKKRKPAPMPDATRQKMLANNKIAFAASILLGAGVALGANTGAVAETWEGRGACMNDAFRFCQSAIPDRGRVFGCLVDNRDQLSPACHSAMAPYLPVTAPSGRIQVR